jgi:hypothetical protein
MLVLCAPLAAQPVDYAKQVHPILAARCLGCHNGKAGQAGLSLAARQDVLRGGASGPAIIPGDSAGSLLLQRITGAKTPRMPIGVEPLPEAAIDTIRKWIDEGARMNVEATPVQAFSLGLKPPKAGGIDDLLKSYYRLHRVAPAARVSDAVFLRRAYLDLWGLLPPPEKLRTFLADARPDKRGRLIDELLANRRNYAEHWISFWNDLLHNDEGVVYHGERSSITPWLLSALEQNRPYNEFARELLAPPAAKGGAAGFIQGVTWRGTVNASQTPSMQAAQNSAQVFLGINLKCNSCHDSFISHWKLREAYSLAAFFTNEPLEIVRCDAPTGQQAQPAFLFPELGAAPSSGSLEEKRAAAARFFTARENGLFARTIVNRVWRLLFGRGLVEPIDEMEATAWHPPLLEWLAADFIENGYDIKRLLRTIMTSEAYQRPSVEPGPQRDPAYVFSGPWPRRLTAEQFADAIASITGEWRVRVDNRPVPGIYAREWRFKANSLARALGRPIRDGAVTERQSESTTLQALELTNGRTLNQWLRDGAARMTGQLAPAPRSLFDSGLMRASTKAEVDLDIVGRKQLRLLIIDVDSYDPSRVKPLWLNARLTGPGGEKSLPAEAQLGREFTIDLTGKSYTRFRATLAIDPSSNQSDISPAIRAFIFENAPDMRRLVAPSGDPPVPVVPPASTPPGLVRQIFEFAFSRAPQPAELKTALALAAPNGKTSREGLQDLLWAVLLSPEFLFIR